MRSLVQIALIYISALLVQHSICTHVNCTFCVVATAFAESGAENSQFSGSYSYPGGVAVLSIAKRSDTLPTVKFGLQEPVILDKGNEWKIMIGLDLETVPGDYLVYIKDNVSEAPAYDLRFKVENKFHSIAEKSSMASGLKITTDLELDAMALSDIDFRNSEQPKLPFLEPSSGTWSENFGALLIDKNSTSEDTSPERIIYTSLAAAELSVVKSPSNAIVSKVSYYQASNGEEELATVYLDHGRGLYSVLSGVSDLSVETGNGIVAGAVIGKLPTSQQQYSTLLWHCVLNGAFINPLILTDQNFAR